VQLLAAPPIGRAHGVASVPERGIRTTHSPSNRGAAAANPRDMLDRQIRGELIVGLRRLCGPGGEPASVAKTGPGFVLRRRRRRMRDRTRRTAHDQRPADYTQLLTGSEAARIDRTSCPRIGARC